MCRTSRRKYIGKYYEGFQDSLIIAAEEAAIESMKKAINPKKAIIVDCISRILFLEEKFNLELDKITSVLRERSPNISISGALTLEKFHLMVTDI